MKQPFFSIILPCFLGDYKGAAKDRANKLIRAIESVLIQKEQDFELVIIADGCEQTFDLVSERYEKESRIECFLIPKQVLWSGVPRQFGVSKAKGTWITYLDSDDKLGPDHLQTIKKNIGDQDWIWFDDYVMGKDSVPYVRTCLIQQKYQSGTSNIAHKKECKILWGNGYGYDDFSAVQSLLKNHLKFAKIPIPEYYTCHIPVQQLDV